MRWAVLAALLFMGWQIVAAVSVVSVVSSNIRNPFTEITRALNGH